MAVEVRTRAVGGRDTGRESNGKNEQVLANGVARTPVMLTRFADLSDVAPLIRFGSRAAGRQGLNECFDSPLR
jgi:hypothetical protein